MREARAAARAMREHSKRAIETNVRHPRYAIVVDADPLTAQLTDNRVTLDAGDLVLSQWARRYDKDHEIDRGDTLLVQPMANGDFLVTDVISDKDV